MFLMSVVAAVFFLGGFESPLTHWSAAQEPSAHAAALGATQRRRRGLTRR